MRTRLQPFVAGRPARPWRFAGIFLYLAATAAVCCVLGASTSAQETAPAAVVGHGPNAPQQIAKHYLILISLDGFRWDYAQRYNASHVLALQAKGASAPQGMIPSYPSVTFPNHYTIVTGLYPEHHGIVENTFYDPQRKQVYSYLDASTVTDGAWYGGTPLWVLAEQQGMRTACFFWPGSEAAIQGVRPSYYTKYDSRFPNEKRVEQVLAWLQLPAAERPHFITLYFSITDSVGHRYGPDSPQEADAVHEVDADLGKLVQGLDALKLPVDLVVVADHGMAAVPPKWLNLDEHGLDLSRLEKYEGTLLYAKSDADAQKIVQSMQSGSSEYKIYRRADLPEHLHFSASPRAGDPVIVLNGAYAVRVKDDPSKPQPNPGEHGFDPSVVPQMKALFVAEGPDIRPGVTVPPFENVDLFPLLAKILGLDIHALKTGPIDGKLSVLQHILIDPN